MSVEPLMERHEISACNGDTRNYKDSDIMSEEFLALHGVPQAVKAVSPSLEACCYVDALLIGVCHKTGLNTHAHIEKSTCAIVLKDCGVDTSDNRLPPIMVPSDSVMPLDEPSHLGACTFLTAPYLTEANEGARESTMKVMGDKSSPGIDTLTLIEREARRHTRDRLQKFLAMEKYFQQEKLEQSKKTIEARRHARRSGDSYISSTLPPIERRRRSPPIPQPPPVAALALVSTADQVTEEDRLKSARELIRRLRREKSERKAHLDAIVTERDTRWTEDFERRKMALEEWRIRKASKQRTVAKHVPTHALKIPRVLPPLKARGRPLFKMLEEKDANAAKAKEVAIAEALAKRRGERNVLVPINPLSLKEHQNWIDSCLSEQKAASKHKAKINIVLTRTPKLVVPNPITEKSCASSTTRRRKAYDKMVARLRLPPIFKPHLL